MIKHEFVTESNFHTPKAGNLTMMHLYNHHKHINTIQSLAFLKALDQSPQMHKHHKHTIFGISVGFASIEFALMQISLIKKLFLKYSQYVSGNCCTS